MIAKEWRDARWKLLIGVLAFLVFLVVAPRPYEKIVAETEGQIKNIKEDIATPGVAGAPEGMRPPENYEERQREELERMQNPGYPVKAAAWEMTDIHYGGNFLILVPLAGLLGVALVSGEVGRGSIFLLLSRPVSRTRALLTKYSVCVISLFTVSLIGVFGTFVSAYARDYPQGSFRVAEILVSSVLFWLGALFVLGLALLCSVIFGDVIKSVVATIVVAYLFYSGPDLLMSLSEFWFFVVGDPANDPRVWEERYMSFQRFDLFSYWTARDLFTGEWVATRNLIVCLVAAVVPLLASLWLFRRRAY